MNNDNDIYHLTPNTKDFYWDCVQHAVNFKIDRMGDHSWCRVRSDHPLEWILDHLDKVTRHSLIIRNHVLDEQNETWENNRHLEVNLELRENQSTYLFSVEIDFQYLNYFVEKYDLTLL
ncbi:MAG: hypothetical protein FWF52_08575 [Candidatus Azobacteroides sp.]|nr:hypothetical protein [Candidatus Azobacteroides sp.]